MTSDSQAVIGFVKDQASSDAYAAYCRNLLAELVEIDTSPSGDLDRVRENEARTIALITDSLRDVLGDRAEIERRPIRPAIESLRSYATPYYTTPDAQGRPQPAAEVYAGRYNLTVRLPGSGTSQAGHPIIHNTHIDTITPWFRPWTDADRVFGRGACDGKGQIASLLAQIKLAEAAREQIGVTFPLDRVYQFVIDEEMGGNGTLSLCDEGLLDGAATICGQMTSNQPHAATRGAVWFACRLDGQGNPRVSEMRMFPFVVEALEQVRARLADECRDARFDPAHVQTNLGLLGPYGTHPSAVADHVAIRLTVKTGANPNRVLMHLTELLDATLADYGVRYGDLTRQLDPITGNPRLAAHYKLTPEPLPDRLGFRLDIHGKAGHMGALTECDNALSKASFLLMAMLRFTRNFPKVVGDAQLIDAPPGPLVLEGGQGFLPTHTLEEVQTRLAEAARTGVRTFCDLTRVPFHEGMVRTTFDKLRSEAHASPVDCPPMRAFAAAFAALGRPCAETRGWPVSCDARLFGQRGLPTVVFGPGSLLQAHSPDEHISIREMQDAVAIGTLADLYLGGALPEPA